VTADGEDEVKEAGGAVTFGEEFAGGVEELEVGVVEGGGGYGEVAEGEGKASGEAGGRALELDVDVIRSAIVEGVVGDVPRPGQFMAGRRSVGPRRQPRSQCDEQRERGERGSPDDLRKVDHGVVSPAVVVDLS
jgi:hypothetical protein